MSQVTIWNPDLGSQPANLALKNNFTAAVDPTVNDDSTEGYEAGSVWINPVDGRGFLCYSAAAGAAVWQLDAQSGGLIQQGAPAALTAAATMTAANLLAGIITSNPAGGIAVNYQLPLATDLDAALPQAVAGSAFDFSIISTSVVAAEDATVTTNTGWTALVGSMVVASNAAATDKSSGRFRARKTAAGAWTLYRLA